MDIQEIIVYLIIAVAVGFIIRYIYRQLTSKGPSCNCGSCPHSCPHTGHKECHCHDTSTTTKVV